VSPQPSLSAYLQSRRAAIDAALDRFLPRPPTCPPVVAESMRYSVFAGGKRLRPILTLASADAVAPDAPPAAGEPGLTAAEATALPAACAMELIHTYSLIHDDLPAMDDDSLRRGRPTAHVVYGEGLAILAGDALLTEAFRLMAEEPRRGDLAERRLRAIAVVGRAAGAEGMVGGQAVDLQASGAIASPSGTAGADGRVPVMDRDALRAMHAMKTGALIRAAAVAGAIMGGGSGEAVAAVDRFAAEVGLAFQIVDDILDVEGASDEIGKTAGKDAAAGKPTYPALFGVEPSRRLARQCVERAHGILAAASLHGQLPALADWVISRTR
jgi:geranylgeranyl diphosphate synthase type II